MNRDYTTLDGAFIVELQKRGIGKAARATFRKVAEEVNQIWAGRAS
jgi:hypothetical protein